MTKEQLASKLNGVEYPHIPPELVSLAIENNLVIVSGYSDDNCELEGIVRDEGSCFDGGNLYVNETGFCEEDCGGRLICALWCPKDKGGAAWAYETEIPHAEFRMLEDGELYCIGLVCDAADFASGKQHCPHCGKELPG